MIVQEGTRGVYDEIFDGEGRGMAELVHDIAPAAEIYFHGINAGTSEAIADAIRALADAGCDIIVDDVTLSREPVYQHGPAAKMVNEVVAEGVHYFSSAGNTGKGRESTLSDSVL